jgi:hypothetical protein
MSGRSSRPAAPPDEPPQAGLPTTSSTRKPALRGDHNLDIETADTARLLRQRFLTCLIRR